jgi:hypothetical protein
MASPRASSSPRRTLRNYLGTCCFISSFFHMHSACLLCMRTRCLFTRRSLSKSTVFALSKCHAIGYQYSLLYREKPLVTMIFCEYCCTQSAFRKCQARAGRMDNIDKVLEVSREVACVSMYMYACICMFTLTPSLFVYVCMCVCVRICMYMHVCMCVCVSQDDCHGSVQFIWMIKINTCVYTHTNTHTHIYIYIYIYI